MKTSIMFIVSGVLLLILSTITPFLIIFPVLFYNTPEYTFAAPGTTEFNITKEGTYYLWNDYKTTFNSKTYNLEQDLPENISFSLKNNNKKEAEDMTEDSSESNTVWNTERVSVGYYDLSPGKYTMTVSGIDETRIFSFGKNQLEKMFPYIGIGMITAILSTPISLILILVGIVLMVIHLMEKSKIRKLAYEAEKEAAE
jgi:ABC-type multidrug transport system fused ATPase/permease subunit